MAEVHRLAIAETMFGLKAAGRLMTEVFAPWVQDLALLVESVEAVRPPGRPTRLAAWRGRPPAILSQDLP